MANVIILKNSGLTSKGDAPTGYKYIGDDSGIMSEKLGATVSAIGAGNVYTKEVIISLSDLGSVGTKILDALGTNKYYKRVSIDLEYTFVTTQWSLTGDTITIQGLGYQNEYFWALFTANQNQLLSLNPTGNNVPSSDLGGVYIPKGANYTSSVNKDVWMFTELGNDPTAGDGVLKAKISYEIGVFG